MGYSVFQNAVIIQLSTSVFQQAAVSHPLSVRLVCWISSQSLHFYFSMYVCVYLCVCVSRILIICIFQSGL